MAMMAPAAAGQIAPRESSQLIETSWHTQALVERLEAAVVANKMGLTSTNDAGASDRARAQGFTMLHHPWQSLGRRVPAITLPAACCPLASCVHRTEPDAMLQ